jgi:lipopolysaccharide transport protein LptA
LMIIIPQRIRTSKTSEIIEVAENLKNEKSTARATGVHYVETFKGQRDWELYAKSAEGTLGPGPWNLGNIKVLYYNQDNVDFTVVGDTGRIDGLTKDMDIAGNVSTLSANGYQFSSSAVSYRSKERTIMSPEEVLMVGPKDEDGDGLILRGKVMVVNVDTNLMVIQQNIVAEKGMKDGKIEIRSNSAEFSGENKTARFIGKVEMKYNQYVLSGPEAQLNYGQKENFLGLIAFKGGVQVKDQDKSATSEKVNMDLKNGVLSLEGRPKVTQGEDEISGDRILFLDQGKKIKVENID